MLHTTRYPFLRPIKDLLRYRTRLRVEQLEDRTLLDAGIGFDLQIQLTPNDPQFQNGNLWGLEKISAPAAWDTTTGSNQIVVAVIDTGIDLDHPDLEANLWVNDDEIANNGIDDDGNGYVDDVNGWNFWAYNNNPDDDNGHGTHVAGTIGGVGNNGIGVVGVNHNVSLMALKFLNENGSGYFSDAAAAIRYAADNGAQS